MKTLRLTAKDFKYTENYWKEYIGKEDVSDYDGNIEIEAKLGYIRFNSIKAKGYILAEAGSGIKAGWGIKAGGSIEAGWGIEAVGGIEAGLNITCKLSLNIAYRIFAGIALWKKEVEESEKTITCGKLEHGEVCYGILKETGIPGEKKTHAEITIDGAVYVLKS